MCKLLYKKPALKSITASAWYWFIANIKLICIKDFFSYSKYQHENRVFSLKTNKTKQLQKTSNNILVQSPLWAEKKVKVFSSKDLGVISSQSTQMMMMMDDYICLPRTLTGPSWAALQPAPAELQQTPGQSLYRLQPPAHACGMPSQSFWQLGAAPIKTNGIYRNCY